MLTALASSAVVLLAAAPAPGSVDDGWSRGDLLVGTGGTWPASGAAQPSSEATVSLHVFRPVAHLVIVGRLSVALTPTLNVGLGF